MKRISFVLAAVLALGLPTLSFAGYFVDEFNLIEGDYEQYLLSTENAEVFHELWGGGWHRAYWAATAPNTWANITYAYDLPFDIAEASLNTGIYCHHGFDPPAEGRIEVSPDGDTWTTVHLVTPYVPPGDQGGAGGLVDVSDILEGSSTAYVRAWLYQTMSMSAAFRPIQFIRSAPGRIDYRFEAIGPPEPMVVPLDIKPGSYPNSINLTSKGVLPVAILSTEDFDALTVDVDSLLFGDPILIDQGWSPIGPIRSSEEDVSGDGLMDLTLKFSIPDLVEYNLLGASTVEGLLTGSTFDEMSIIGTDSIRIVGKAVVVPEPASVMLVLVGLVCVAVHQRRAKASYYEV